jgi:aldehyde:ferredoxin oxidoreductase
MDSLILCKFLRGVFPDLLAEGARMLSAVTGWDVTREELRETATRVLTLKKLYNVREGWTRAEDTLPPRFLAEPLGDGASAGASLTRGELDRMIAAYYRARGWTPEGEVPDAQIRALGLDDLFPVPMRESRA